MSRDWIDNELPEGVQAAKGENKPLVVVFRCIPCEACLESDDDVERDGFIGLQVYGISKGEGPHLVRWRGICIRELRPGETPPGTR